MNISALLIIFRKTVKKFQKNHDFRMWLRVSFHSKKEQTLCTVLKCFEIKGEISRFSGESDFPWKSQA